MSTTKDLFITSRSILTAAALGGLSLITPHGAFADGYNSETVEFLAFPDLSESDVEAIVRQRAEQEAALIIEEAMATGFSIDIGGAGFWKVTANVEHKVQPFVVYETVNGVKKVYKKAATNDFFRLALGKRKVG